MNFIDHRKSLVNYHFKEAVARPEGLEPPAYWFEANRSIQLSYGRGLGDRDLMVSPRVPR
jgi:hypothetical protein